MNTLPQRTVDLGEVSSFVVISDVHLALPDQELTTTFLRTLENPGPCDTLFLLGDVFDFIYVGSPFFLRFWKDVFDRLESLGKRGTRIVFVEGNHDFGFEHAFPEKLRKAISLGGDLAVRCRHPALGNILLRHGDDVVCREKYLEFRATIKAKWFQNLTRWIPGSVMQFIFSRWARLSRHQDTYRKLEPAFFFECLDKRQFTPDAAPIDVLVLGHVHEHIDTRHRGVRCLAGPSWLAAPNVLRCDARGNLSREFVTGQRLPLSEGFLRS